MKKSIRKLHSFGKRLGTKCVIEVYFKRRLKEVIDLNREYNILSNAQLTVLKQFHGYMSKNADEKGLRYILIDASVNTLVNDTLTDLLSVNPIANLYKHEIERLLPDSQFKYEYSKLFYSMLDKEIKALPKQVTIENMYFIGSNQR